MFSIGDNYMLISFILDHIQWWIIKEIWNIIVWEYSTRELIAFNLLILFLIIVMLGGGTLGYLQKFLQ
jgi:hypothetical protein